MGNWTVIWVVVRRWRAILLISCVDCLRFINCCALWRNLWLSRRCIGVVVGDVALIDRCGVVWGSLLDWERREAVVRIDRWRLTSIGVVGTAFVPLRLVEHGRVLGWVTIRVCVDDISFRDFVSVRSDSGRDLCFGLGQNIVWQLNVTKCAWTCWVLHTDDLVVVYIFRNRNNLVVVDCTCLSNVSFGVRYRRGWNSASSRLSDIMLTVDGRWWDCATRLSIQSIIVIRDVTLCCGLDSPRFVLRRALMTNRAVNRWRVRRVRKDQLAGDGVLAWVRRSCFNDLRARLADKKKKIALTSPIPCVRRTSRLIYGKCQRNTHSKPESMPILLLDKVRLSVKSFVKRE